MLNANEQTKVVVNQMFSKDLTMRRNNALKRRHQLLNNPDNNLQVNISSHSEKPTKRFERQMGNPGNPLTLR